MLLIVEIAMLIGGIYAIATAKVPGFLIGGGKYQVEGTTARLFGVLLVLPLPIAFIGGFISFLVFLKTNISIKESTPAKKEIAVEKTHKTEMHGKKQQGQWQNL